MTQKKENIHSILKPKSIKLEVLNDWLTEGKGSITSDVFKTQSNPDNQWKLEQRAYKTYGPLTNAVDSTAEVAAQNFHMGGENEDFVKEIDMLNQKLRMKEKVLSIFKRLEVFGNAFLLTKTNKDLGITDAKLLPTIGMTVNVDKFGDLGKPAYTQFKGEGANETDFSKDEIIHFSLENIDSSPYGMSPVLPLLKDISIFNQTKSQSPIIIQRYAAPMIHAVIGNIDKEIFPTQVDIDAWSKDLEDIYSNTEWVTGPEVEIKTLGFEGKALDISKTLEFQRDDVIMGLRVPRDVLSLPEGSNKGQAEETGNIWRTRIETLQEQVGIDMMEGVYKPHLSAIFGEQILQEAKDVKDLKVKKGDKGIKDEKDPEGLKDLPEIVWEGIEKEDERVKIDIVIKLLSNGLVSLKKAIELLPEEFREDDAGIADLMNKAAEKEEQDKEMMMNKSQGSGFGKDTKFNPKKNIANKPKKKPFGKEWYEPYFTEAKISNVSKENEQVPGMAALENDYGNFLIDKLNFAFNFLVEDLPVLLGESKEIKEAKDVQLSDVDEAFNKFMIDVRDEGREIPLLAYEKGFNKASQELSVTLSFNTPDYDTLNFLASKNSDLLLTVSEELKGRVKTGIRLGIEQGEGVPAISKRLGSVKETYKNRLKTIARTEVSSAVNQGRMNGYKESGVVEEVEWSAAMDNRTAPDDAMANGTIVKLGESFPHVGVSQPPAHPNCRCGVLPVINKK